MEQSRLRSRLSAHRPRIGPLLVGVALLFAVLASGGRPEWALYGQLLLVLAATGVVVLTSPGAAWKTRGVPALVVILALLLVQIAARPALRVPGLALAAVAVASLLLARLLIARDRRLAVALTGLLILLGAAEAALGLMQSFGGVEAIGESFRDPTRLARGTFTNRNHLAGFLNIAFGALLGTLYATLERGRESRPAGASEKLARSWILLLGGSLIGLSVLLSRSRGGVVSLVLTLLACAVILWLQRRPGGRGALPLLAVALLLATLLGLGASVGVDTLAQRLAASAGSNRLQIYADSLQLLGDHPVLGVGAGMYRWRFRAYQTSGLDFWYTHAHNDYLETAVDWGLPLALLVWGFVGWRWLRVTRLAVGGGDSRTRGLALGCALAMFALLVHGLVDFNLHIPANLMAFGLLAGMGWSLEAGERGERRAAESRGGPWRWVPRILLLVIVLAAGWRTSRLLAAELRIRGASSVDDLKTAAAIAPGLAEAHFLLGRLHGDWPEFKDHDLARHHLRRAVDANPWSWRYHWQLAELEEISGRAEEAAAAYRRAVELNPRSGQYRWRLANFWLRRGDSDAALAELRTALALDPSLREPAWQLLARLDLEPSRVLAAWPADRESRWALLRLATAPPRPLATAALLEEWDRLVADSTPSPEEGGFFVEFLAAAGRLEEARRQWLRLARAAGYRDAAFEAGRSHLWNGDFELPQTSGPLDWRWHPATDQPLGTAAAEGLDGSRALSIDFDGSREPAPPALRQRILGGPAGGYVFAGSLRSAGDAARAGLQLEIGWRGAAGFEREATAEVPATPGWQQVRHKIAAPSAGHELEIRLRRSGRPGPQDRLTGSVWLDRLALEPLP